MNSKKQNIINLELFKGFFYFGYNKWIIGISVVLLSAIFIYFINFHAISVFPSKGKFNLYAYNDKANGGNSEITQSYISDSILKLDFYLKEGFFSPYVGLSISPAKDSVIDLSHYNLIRLNVKGLKIKTLGISLYTRNPYKKNTVNSAELCFNANLEISSEQDRYYIHLEQLKVPDWWLGANNISPNNELKPDLKHVVRLNIGTAYTPILNEQCVLQFKSISFERNNSELILYLTVIESLIIISLFLFYFIRTKTNKTAIPVTISYKPIEVETENHSLKDFLDYINNNFQESDLTLEQVSNQTGINQRRIANFIQQNFGCNFKTYINQIRINEAKRLLKETNLNMGEIAFKVGFSNQSHFNRVFKSLVNINPSEFRETEK
jgi:AraC-like DNA-binding protein